jgi:serine/threonine protein kinase
VQTDVWSVGVNLYQFLTGTMPFPNKEPSALIAAIMMREFEPLSADIPNNLQNVIAKALAKQPENRYDSAGAMREDLRRVLRGEAVADFIHSDLQQNYSASGIPPTQKVASNFAQSSQDENETIIRSVPNFGQSENHKSSNVWIYATIAFVLVSAISVGVYFWENQSKQDDSNKSRAVQTSPTQPSNNSANSENINASIVSNTNITTPTPISTPNKAQLQRTINQHVSNFLRGITKGDFTFEELKGKRKLFYGDIDNDGDEDVALQYTWTNSYGGDAWGINIANF